METRLLCTREAPVHDKVKQQLVEASELDTQLILRKFRNTSRIVKNSVAVEVAEIERRPNSEFSDVAGLVTGMKGTEVFETGNLEAGTWSAGVSAGLVYDVPSVGKLVSRIIAEAEEIIGGRLVGMAG